MIKTSSALLTFLLCHLYFNSSPQSLTPFTKNGKQGVKNNEGEIIIKPLYDYVYDFAVGMLAVNIGGQIYDESANADGGKWGFCDYAGKKITPLKYDNAMPLRKSTDNTLVVVNIGCKSSKDNPYCVGGKWGLIDKTGKEIVPLMYNQIYAEVLAHETQVALVKRNGKYGYLDCITGLEITPIKYDEGNLFRWFSEAKVRVGNKWGFVDKTGKEIIPLIYDEASFFENEKSKVKLGDREFYIDKTGKEVK
jgi:hypothetical protein